MNVLKGKEVQITGKIRPKSDYIGRPYLQLNVTTQKPERDVLRSSGQGLNKESWNTHTIPVKIPNDAEKLNLIIISVGIYGTVDFDEIEIKYKEKGVWKNYDLTNSGFGNAKTFQADWNPWGDNQDSEIVTESNKNFLRVSRTKGKLTSLPPLFEADLSNRRTVTKNIGSNLNLTFPVVLKGNSENTFPVTNKNAYEKLLKDIESSTTNKFTTEVKFVRLANIMKIWTTLEHFYPYFDRTDVDWENQFYKAVAKNRSDKTVEDHIETLKLMITPFKRQPYGSLSFV